MGYLTGIAVSGVETIELVGEGTAVFSDPAIAMLAVPILGDISLNLVSGSFTPGQRLELFLRGFASVKDASGDYANAAPSVAGFDAWGRTRGPR